MPALPAAVSIRLNRATGENSLDHQTITQLRAALATVGKSPEVRCVVLQGRPGSFCAGMDLTEAVGSDNHRAEAGSFFDLLSEIAALPAVVIAAVDGQATGGGVGLVAACDVVVASRRSSFSLPEALWGLLPCCVYPFLARRVGDATASRLALTTTPIGTHEALRLGLVDIEATEVVTELRKYVSRLQFVEGSTIRSMKALRTAFTARPDAARELAVSELTRLLAEPVVKRRLQEYGAAGSLPSVHDRPSRPAERTVRGEHQGA